MKCQQHFILPPLSYLCRVENPSNNAAECITHKPTGGETVPQAAVLVRHTEGSSWLSLQLVVCYMVGDVLLYRLQGAFPIPVEWVHLENEDKSALLHFTHWL